MCSLLPNLFAIYCGQQTDPTLTGPILGVIDDAGHTQMDTERNFYFFHEPRAAVEMTIFHVSVSSAFFSGSRA